MRAVKIGIYCSDLDYSKALMDYINAHDSIRFKPVVFSDKSRLDKYLETGSLDLIIVDDEAAAEFPSLLYEGINVVVLTEHVASNVYVTGESVRDGYIYRYQNTGEICKRISSILMSYENDNRDISETVAVFSPVERCGRTTLAKALAGYDEIRGGLYVGMENYSDDPSALLSNILYDLLINKPDLDKRISDAIRPEQGIHKICISGTYLDANDVTCKDMERLIEILKKTGNYTTICFDIGSAVLSDFSILRLFKKIYMPVLTDETSMKKIEVFMKLLADMGFQDVIRRLHPVEVPNVPYGSEELIKTVWKIKNGEKDG